MVSKEINREKMECSEIKDKMIAYLDKDLPEAVMIAYRDHLGRCDNCMYIYNKVKAQWKIIDEEKQIKPDAFYFSRLEQALHNPEDSRSDRTFSFITHSVKTMAAVLLLLISVAAGIFIGSRFTGEAGTTEYSSEYEYYSDMMYLNTYENETIENYLLSQEEE